ncbi:MAG: putative oxygen-independent coproporphyrinogen oxidase [Candidatus Angelobacter sp.]|jgi:oxygen-independent coproporphyrinogen-3 oxidase|nr:putative oxygen-independent coproporphyrinogen oxidase [Candidatus Angelobacter sp.]
MPLGIYISVPFCKSKCSFCNFASGVFSRERMDHFVQRACSGIANAEIVAGNLGSVFERQADTIYFGGGTPTTLQPRQLQELFAAVRNPFDVSRDAEVTVECAPGTISPEILDTLVECGVNRVSLGVQSFVDEESRAVGRLHSRAITLADIARLRAAGITNINVDLIAGLPHQTRESWNESLEQVIAAGVPHVSIYMLEVDEDSRLGNELIAGGTRYHAHHVPDEDLTAEFYETACEKLEAAGVAQYEISNFARPGFESKHNLKYWTRQPYLGFGLDAHSMLRAIDAAAVRFSTTDDLESFLSAEITTHSGNPVTEAEALEEEFFLGLRLNRGIDLREISSRMGRAIPQEFEDSIADLVREGLLITENKRARLSARGRLLSNEVFARFIGIGEKVATV